MTKPSTPRSKALRERRDKLGLHRRDVAVHKDDWPEVRRLVNELAAKRVATGEGFIASEIKKDKAS